MPFSKEFEGIYFGIKEACKSTGNHCERVDEQTFSGTILSRIYNQIAKADLIISEITIRNPNVFYETGYAHALGKRVILLAETAAELPFDVSGYPCVLHENSVKKLNEELTKLIPAVLLRKSSAPLAASSLICYLGDRRLKEGNFVRAIVPLGSTKRALTVKLRFAVNNPTDTILDTENVEFGMIVSTEFCSVESRSVAPNGDLLANQLVRLPANKTAPDFGGPVTGNSKRLLPGRRWKLDLLFPVTDWPRLRNVKSQQQCGRSLKRAIRISILSWFLLRRYLWTNRYLRRHLYHQSRQRISRSRSAAPYSCRQSRFWTGRL